MSQKKLIDLTHSFVDNMPVYPGDPCAKLYQSASIKKDGFSDHIIESGMHVGTHMDAPIHMVDGGLYISDIPLDHFQGRGVLINAIGHMEICADMADEADLQEGDIVLIHSGWDKKYFTEDYFKQWPVFTEGFAKKLVEKKVSLIGMDMAGPEMDETFPIHKILLSNNVLIIENMTGLEQLIAAKDFIVHAYPVKYKACGAPVRVVAEIL